MNILFLADPNSVHDIKWMTFFSKKHTCFLIARQDHLTRWSQAGIDAFFRQHNIKIIGGLQDFSIRRPGRTVREWHKLKHALKWYRIDVFHVMYAEPNALWGFFRRPSTNVRWLLTTRGTDVLKTIPQHYRQKDFLNRMVTWFYRNALVKFDQVTSTSLQQKAQMQKLASGVPVEIVRTGVDVERILQDKQNLLPQSMRHKKYVLFPRNMRPLYNHEFSLQAIRLLPKEIKQQYCFVFVDRDSTTTEYVHQIEEMMAKDIETDFLFLNRQPQEVIWEMYKGASLVVMNPLSDGSPVSAMEAMVCNVPVILSNLSYDEDIFDHSVLRLTSWNPEELSQLIASVLLGKITVNKEKAAANILKKGNRILEMEKLEMLYQGSKQ